VPQFGKKGAKGSKSFPYTKAGEAKARDFAKKTGRKMTEKPPKKASGMGSY
jgi:hypothetical protein